MHRLLSALGAALALAFVAAGADARTESQTSYTKLQTYSGALRYLRVDLGYEITEKDADAAYLLFKYVIPGKKSPVNGSVEIVENDGRVRVVVQLPQMPAYHESALRDGLMKKLQSEYGAPPAKAKSDKEKKKPKDKDKDEGKDGDDSADKDEGKRDGDDAKKDGDERR